MNRKKIGVLILILFLLYLNNSQNGDSPFVPNPTPTPTPVPEPIIEPDWIDIEEEKQYDKDIPSVNDLERRMPANHSYRDEDKCTHVHETTHGLHAKIRNKYYQDYDYEIQPLYVFDGKCCIIQNPKAKMSDFNRKIPKSLVGGMYNLYLISQSSQFNDEPLYLMDEWVAYTNGPVAALEADMRERNENNFYRMFEMGMYVYVMGMHCIDKFPSSEDLEQFRRFLIYNTDRMLDMLNDNRAKGWDIKNVDDILQQLKGSDDCRELRDFLKKVMGEEYTIERFGF